ncbi:MAG: HU family DNA-binding protein [Clostridia bacterium]|nr:HU family DNA-binding protein [Clostridia bacterium]MBR2288261.1 HU family DNA-binding protein [Clostridia bacterium]
MTKRDLIKGVASLGLSQGMAEQAVEKILTSITESLARGEDVNIYGFGNFEVRDRKARMGRNPRTGENVMIPDRKAVRFKAGKLLVEHIQ